MMASWPANCPLPNGSFQQATLGGQALGSQNADVTPSPQRSRTAAQ